MWNTVAYKAVIACYHRNWKFTNEIAVSMVLVAQIYNLLGSPNSQLKTTGRKAEQR